MAIEPDLSFWPLMLPGHREIIAAHCLPHVARIARHGTGAELDVLSGLAQAAGPFGVATALTFAYGLAAVRERDRIIAVDAVTCLARADGLDAVLLGQQLALLLNGEGPATVRAARSLGLVGRGGAWHVVWAAAHTAIPVLLRSAEPPTGLPDLLNVAAAAAAATGARAVLPELSAAAAGAENSRLAREAARLLQTVG